MRLSYHLARPSVDSWVDKGDVPVIIRSREWLENRL